MANGDSNTNNSPLSLKRLTSAFAQMLGPQTPTSAGATNLDGSYEQPVAVRDPCEISPRSIVEAILFVGAEQGKPRTAEQLAGAMRDVSPEEIARAVEELNETYELDGAPYYIVHSEGSYQLTLRPEMARMRDKFHGRAKETKLSAGAMEVLSIVAYEQPITLARVDKLRGGRSSPLLASLVRRGLVRLDRPEESETSEASAKSEVHYQTTDRFLRVFGLENVDQLPRAAEMAD